MINTNCCAEEVLGSYRMNPATGSTAGSSAKGRGIFSASGVCSCSDSHGRRCSCIPALPEGSSASSASTQSSAAVILGGASPAYRNKNLEMEHNEDQLTVVSRAASSGLSAIFAT